MFKDIMLDLETLGTAPGCTVLSIGAVAFDSVYGLGDTFDVIISRGDSERVGLTEHPDNVRWWEQQSFDAQETLRQATEAGLTVEAALARFGGFVETITGGEPGVRVWGNGAGFDQPILRGLYKAIQLKHLVPWDWWNDRCFRTLRGLAPHLAMPRTGVLHNALDDAITQAEHAVRVMQYLRLNAAAH